MSVHPGDIYRERDGRMVLVRLVLLDVEDRGMPFAVIFEELCGDREWTDGGSVGGPDCVSRFLRGREFVGRMRFGGAFKLYRREQIRRRGAEARLAAVVRERDEARAERDDWERMCAEAVDREGAADERVRVLGDEAQREREALADLRETFAQHATLLRDSRSEDDRERSATLDEVVRVIDRRLAAASALAVTDSDPEGAVKDDAYYARLATAGQSGCVCGAAEAWVISERREECVCSAGFTAPPPPASSSGGVTPEVERAMREMRWAADGYPMEGGKRVERPGVTPEGRGGVHRLRFEWDGDSEWPTVSLVCPPNHAGCQPPVCLHGEQVGCEFGCPPSKEPCWIETWEGADVHDITGVVEVPVSVKSADNESAPKFTIVGPPVSSAAVDAEAGS